MPFDSFEKSWKLKSQNMSQNMSLLQSFRGKPWSIEVFKPAQLHDTCIVMKFQAAWKTVSILIRSQLICIYTVSGFKRTRAMFSWKQGLENKIISVDSCWTKSTEQVQLYNMSIWIEKFVFRIIVWHHEWWQTVILRWRIFYPTLTPFLAHHWPFILK